MIRGAECGVLLEGKVILRAVTVTIAPGQSDAYWSWAHDIVALWNECGIRRAGGPYELSGSSGESIALWLTVHETPEDARTAFESLYSSGRGQELIERRPSLAAATYVATYDDWQPDMGSSGTSMVTSPTG